MPHLTKSEFIHYLNCPKSFWLKQHKPDVYPERAFSAFQEKLVTDGYAVEREVRRYIDSLVAADRHSFQQVFETDDGLLARADLVRDNEDGTIDLFEIKSSTSIKDKPPNYQLKDATFQAIVAKRCGHRVDKVFIVHLNKGYVRRGPVDPASLLVFFDVTDWVEDLLDETEEEIAAALDLLARDQIDESSCSCLYLGKGRHCDSFDYFNPTITTPSIYDLPRIATSKNFQRFVSEGRFSLDEIAPEELSPSQQLVLQAHRAETPVIDQDAIRTFLGDLKYPLHFLDYEAFASAVPMIAGARPHAQIPFQFSLHILDEEGTLTHHEYLAETAEMPKALIEALETTVAPTGSVVSWHMAYENTRNKEMAAYYPEHQAFLHDLVARTVDLEDVFKAGYVDIAFRGSTSIKKVLPVLVPEMTYEGMEIADGTAAMEGWLEMVSMLAGEARASRRSALLEYCEQDTMAMVRIFQCLSRLAGDI